MAYLDEIQLKEMGFKSVGENVKISDKASFYGCDNISIGNNVRIDDFACFQLERVVLIYTIIFI